MRERPTMGADWIYVAVPFEGQAIRASVDLREVDERLRLWWGKAATAFGASLVVLAVLAALAARALSKPLEAAAEGAARYARGEFEYRLPLAGSSEMRKLSSSLGSMAEELDSRFKLIGRQREEMRTVFENMSEGVLAVDPDGRIMLLNRQAELMLNLPKGATGKMLESVSRSAGLLDAVRDAGLSDKPLEREIRVEGTTGGETLLEAHAARMRGSRGELNVLTVLRDVTQLKRLETMRRDFVANVSHELRTPVTTIQSCLETLLDEKDSTGGDSGDSQEFLEMALRNTRRMGSIIGNLLLLAGMESGSEKITGNVAPNAVRPVIDEALALCREDAEERGVFFNVSCDPDLIARMNPQLIVHALVNLLDNAVKYGPGGGEIGVVAQADGGKVQIVVSDNGPGIAPKHQQRVFERFYRVGGSTRIKKGTGLGLALARHIALAQDGDITLESEIGAGSVFRLILPRG
jgi:two-component system phosphate regulon sensor histidine kinase PhoR